MSVPSETAVYTIQDITAMSLLLLGLIFFDLGSNDKFFIYSGNLITLILICNLPGDQSDFLLLFFLFTFRLRWKTEHCNAVEIRDGSGRGLYPV